MTRIIYQTDEWNNDSDRLELDWPEGYTTCITISGKTISIKSDYFLDITIEAGNHIVIST